LISDSAGAGLIELAVSSTPVARSHVAVGVAQAEAFKEVGILAGRGTG
jgi:hypothetical protein